MIWAHVGLGRVVRPVENQLAMVERALADSGPENLYFDISWDETAKYIVSTPQAVHAAAELIERFPGRFLFGTDAVAPQTQENYLETYELYRPLLSKLSPDAKHALLMGNYERIFDEGRRRARRWEAAHVGR
jgi:predicted TIM-barrel fold metal-dependent hydrolase